MWQVVLLLSISIPPNAVFIAADPCASSPCKNGATCEPASYNSNDFQCLLNCPSNCYGYRCDYCVPTSAVCSSCPAGFTQVVPGSCFKYNPSISYNFTQADDYCQTLSARSVTIYNDGEEYAIRMLMNNTSPMAWTGFGHPNGVSTLRYIDGSNSTFGYCGSTLGAGSCFVFGSLGVYTPFAAWKYYPCTNLNAVMCRQSCGTVRHPCDASPCKNGATCEPASYNSYDFQCTLNCPSNCYGQRCDVCVPTTSVCASCPAGFTQIIPGSCINYITSNYNFTQADAYCQSVGARLATINNADEEYEMRKLMGTTTSAAWIGYGDPTSSGTPSWVDGSSITYAPLASTIVSGYCATVFAYPYVTALNYGWVGNPCNSTYRMICRGPCGVTTTTTPLATPRVDMYYRVGFSRFTNSSYWLATAIVPSYLCAGTCSRNINCLGVTHNPTTSDCHLLAVPPNVLPYSAELVDDPSYETSYRNMS